LLGDLFGEMKQKSIYDEKPYLTMEEPHAGDLRMGLFVPPYDLEELKAGYKKKLTMYLDKK